MGDLRFAKPEAPGNISGVQDGSYGPSCVQAVPYSLLAINDLGETPIGILINDVLEEISGGASEDCLFLDIQVPGKAVRDPDSYSLPVVMWFFGGGYTWGSKSQLTGAVEDLPILPLYEGTGVIKESNNEMIFAAANYRVSQ